MLLGGDNIVLITRKEHVNKLDQIFAKKKK